MQADLFGWVGATINDRYRIDEVVGEGGFGVVYRGYHLGFSEAVAIKCLKFPGSMSGPEREAFQATFIEEGRILHRLSRASAGIVQALDVGAAFSPTGVWTPYLALEWLRGVPLNRELKDRRARGEARRPLSEAIALLAPAARALDVAHLQGVAHRDVKPANLFLAEVGDLRTLKVLDFGIAKVMSDFTSTTQAFAEIDSSLQAFTPQYGAPEQFRRELGATGPWTDVFALALVLIEVVTGQFALGGSNVMQLYIAATDRAHRPSLGRAGVPAPAAVEAALQRAVAVEPRERYRTAGKLWDALEAALGPPAPAPATRAGDPSAGSTQKEGNDSTLPLVPLEHADSSRARAALLVIEPEHILPLGAQYALMLEKEILRAREGNKKLSVLMFDVENLRSIELLHGRERAHLLFKDFARVVQTYVPTGGFLARYRDMLALVVPGAGRTRAGALVKVLGERVRKQLVDLSPSSSVQVKMRIAAAHLEETDVSGLSLLERASRALSAVSKHQDAAKAPDVRQVGEAVRDAAPRKEPAKLYNNRILWVDDHPEGNANVHVFEAFKALGLKLTLALSTQEALEQLTKQQFGAIISDMIRKEGVREGYVLLDAISKRGDRTPFFIYTRLSSPEHRRLTKERGGQGCTDDGQELVEMVTRVLVSG